MSPARTASMTQSSLSFSYDEAGDILYIDAVPPYEEQESEELSGNLVARRNPKTGAVENLEVLFFSQGILRGVHPKMVRLRELFAAPVSTPSEAKPAVR
jgi:hypothetical protein